MSKKKVLCSCYGVTRKDIEKAVRAGADTYKKVRKVTDAGSRCGDCENDVRKEIKRALKRQEAEAEATVVQAKKDKKTEKDKPEKKRRKDKQAERKQQETAVSDADSMRAAVDHALSCGATMADAQYGGDDYVTMVDPAGHPFCFVIW